jgi:hypothetical protein
MALATVAAVLWALDDVLGGVSYAVYNGAGALATSRDLTIASSWLTFAAAFVVLSATCYVAWSLFLNRKWSAVWETAGAVLATLIFGIGVLIAATQAPGPSDAAFVVSAIGVGGWAVLIVVTAARHGLLEQGVAGRPRQASLRLAAAAAVVLLAIAVGLPNVSLSDATLEVATSVIYMAAFGGLVSVLSIARARQLITTKHFPVLAAGLWGLAFSSVANAISGGLIFGPPPYSLVSVRVGLSVPLFIEAVAVLVLAWAALSRLGELPVSSSMTPPAPPHLSDVGRSMQAPPPWHDTPSMAPASWQLDPARRHELRWWDGVHWTEHVLDSGRQSTDPPE